MSKLLNKYETRIKNFVYKMSETPYIIKKYKGIYTPKHSSPIQNTNTFYQKIAFSFKKYKSDRERINEILEKNALLEEYYKKMNEEKERLKKYYQIKFAPKLIQPNMHFQYKNDGNIINKKFAKKLKVLEIKSKSVDNYKIEEINEDTENNEENDINNFNNTNNKNNNKKNKLNKTDYNLTEEQIRQKNLHKKILEDRKNMINTRKVLMNLEGGNTEKRNYKYSLGEVYRKTEFKAMENLKMFKTSTMNRNILKKWQKEDQEKQMNIKLNNLFHLTENNLINNKAMTRNNKSKTDFYANKYTNFFQEVNPIIKDINNSDEFDNNNESFYNANNKDLYNFNIIKEKSYINKRRMKLSENNKTLKNFKINNDISKKNPLLYNLYFMDNISKENKVGINEEQFNQIKKLAFKEKNNENENESKQQNEKIEEELINEDNIIFKKERKKLSADKLAEKLLNETNWNLRNKYKAKYDLLNTE